MDAQYHPLVCPRVWGQYSMKHDQMVSICAAIARDLGLKAEFFDLEVDEGKRPGDWIETADLENSYLAILCDLTIHAGPKAGAQYLANGKKTKYAA